MAKRYAYVFAVAGYLLAVWDAGLDFAPLLYYDHYHHFGPLADVLWALTSIFCRLLDLICVAPHYVAFRSTKISIAVLFTGPINAVLYAVVGYFIGKHREKHARKEAAQRGGAATKGGDAP